MMLPTQNSSRLPLTTFDSRTIRRGLHLATALAPAVLIAMFCLALPHLWAQAAAPAAGSAATHGIAAANMNLSVKPGDDFYRYANGAWIDRTAIPPDRSAVDVFDTLDDLSRKRTAEIIEEAAKSNAPAGSDKRKMADVYNAFMDEIAIEAKGLDPLKEQLAALAAIQDRKQLSLALGRTLRADVDLLNNSTYQTANLFGLWVAPGFRDSDHYVPYLLQGGIAMPNRDYYLADSDRMKEVRAKYAVHVAAIFRLAGFSDAEARATRVIALEHSIAEAQVSIAEIEEIAKANNLWKRSDFAAKAPGLDWDAYFEGAGLARQQEFMVWTPTAFAGEAALVASVPLETWKDWLAYHFVEDYASYLPKALSDERQKQLQNAANMARDSASDTRTTVFDITQKAMLALDLKVKQIESDLNSTDLDALSPGKIEALRKGWEDQLSEIESHHREALMQARDMLAALAENLRASDGQEPAEVMEALEGRMLALEEEADESAFWIELIAEPARAAGSQRGNRYHLRTQTSP